MNSLLCCSGRTRALVALATLFARLCPHPKVARYLGLGSIDDADDTANFACVKPQPADDD